MKAIVNAAEYARLRIDFVIMYGEEGADRFMAAHFVRADPIPVTTNRTNPDETGRDNT